MHRIKDLWRSAFDVRKGERLRTLFMFLYLFFVLFVHYILKTISRAMFVTKFGSDELPNLYILIAVAGGILAAVYTGLALRTSLDTAVGWMMGLSVVSLLGFWQLLPHEWRWLLYGFNIWAQLFGVIIVAQGWLVASNVFTSREAKRLYGPVGLGGVLGAWIGSVFTRAAVRPLGPYTLTLVCALMVALAYLSYRLTAAQKGVALSGARATQEDESKFSSRDILGALARHRHLQVITAIIVITYVVDQLVEFQLQAAGQRVYSNTKDYSVFLSTYYLYQNIITFVLQFGLTGVVVSKLGVGSTLRLMPVALAVTSVGPLVFPGVLTAQITRLTEAATRYSVNRTAMELLYLPLPVELRNRTKAFIDVFGDRLGRGFAGVLLIVLARLGFKENFDKLPLVVIGFTLVWVLLSILAQKEYILTIRRRLDARRLELETARVAVRDPSMIALLEEAARGQSPRQAVYALSVLAEAPGYPLDPLLVELAGSPWGEVRAQTYGLARSSGSRALLARALEEVRSAEHPAATREAVRYAVQQSPDAAESAREFLGHPASLVVEALLEVMPELPVAVRQLLSLDWISRNAASPDPGRRRLAAIAIGVAGEENPESLRPLLAEPDREVVIAACRAAGRLQERTYLHALFPRLADARMRRPVIESLAMYGVRITGTLGDMLEDDRTPPAVRRQIPRVLRLIREQRSVDVLLRSMGQQDLTVRAAVLKALNHLREAAPELDYGGASVTAQILDEARSYFRLNAALSPFRGRVSPRTAAGLLALSIQERLQQTLDRLFRLLGLRYPPKEIYAAYLAVNRKRTEQAAAALEFLDNVLDRELKRIVVPLLDDSSHLLERGRSLFGVEGKSAEEAIRELIASGDEWLVVCAAAAAGELKLRGLAPDIDKAARGGGRQVCQVAEAALSALA